MPGRGRTYMYQGGNLKCTNKSTNTGGVGGVGEPRGVRGVSPRPPEAKKNFGLHRIARTAGAAALAATGHAASKLMPTRRNTCRTLPSFELVGG